LTSQAEVQPNTSYCGGKATSRIVLASGDTWTGGEVTGASSVAQQGAVQCDGPCTLVNLNIHDNPNAFAGIYLSTGAVAITGGRVTRNGSLGVGGSQASPLSISGVEIDHNGASANCDFEGGGFKGVNQNLHFFRNYVHDNYCNGVWLDINAANVEIDHNRIDNNAASGIFYEISQAAIIHDNDVSGNGFHDARSRCTWLWDGGITLASSFNVQVYGNLLTDNCNQLTGIQQNRTDNTPPQHLLENDAFHDNTVSGGGRSGWGADTGADLAARNLMFAGNTLLGDTTYCALAC
jgi:parallel beta-helix repeat protein